MLNKDIETLLAKQGVRLVDQRHTAGNLRLLCSVLTVGEGEVPGRKGGTVGALGKDERAGLDEGSMDRDLGDGEKKAKEKGRGMNDGTA